MNFSEIESVHPGTILQFSHDREVRQLEVDSRKVLAMETTLFFAIAGQRHDGHRFLMDLYRAGVRQFVVEREVDLSPFPDSNFFRVQSSIRCLQAIVGQHRNCFSMPVVGITGSNGKTIIKEWLYQLLSEDNRVVKNPGSYNSQIGVPLSVWAMQSHHNLGIFEAGISAPGEMEKLGRVIRPTLGIFTNLGTAHDEGFDDPTQKLHEKLNLFSSAQRVIYCKDHRAVDHEMEKRFPGRSLSWGEAPTSTIRMKAGRDQEHEITAQHTTFRVRFPFSDMASIENACHCIALMLHLGYEGEVISERIQHLKTVPMRLELKQGIQQTQIIDDTYNNDLGGLRISLNFLAGMKKERNTLILSDLLQSGLKDEEWVDRIGELLSKSVVTHFIGIGKGLTTHRQQIEQHVAAEFYNSVEDFLAQVNWSRFQNEVILVKGARPFRFERLVKRLQNKIHGTVMEIDLSSMVHNLNYFRSVLRPGVKLMVMVKAFAYGSGSEEVTNMLQYHKVDYLGVAYADEGITLRKNRILLPIMVMNPSTESFSGLLENNLEPELFSLSLLKSFLPFLEGRGCTVHIKLDTGMHRLGFVEEEIPEVIDLLRRHKNVVIGSIFSHLAGADDPSHDLFTREQAKTFLRIANHISDELQIRPLLHILNSSGILRFPEWQLNMVRLGIGLYGVNLTMEKNVQLRPVATLKTTISQIKKIHAGETIGYGRRGRAQQDILLATISIGYADGYSRNFSNGAGVVFIHGQLAPVIGNVCMDMTMVDVTGIDVKEGDEVIIFGRELPIQQIADRIQTIPYEILTSTNERVKRVFYTESM